MGRASVPSGTFAAGGNSTPGQSTPQAVLADQLAQGGGSWAGYYFSSLGLGSYASATVTGDPYHMNGIAKGLGYAGAALVIYGTGRMAALAWAAGGAAVGAGGGALYRRVTHGDVAGNAENGLNIRQIVSGGLWGC